MVGPSGSSGGRLSGTVVRDILPHFTHRIAARRWLFTRTATLSAKWQQCQGCDGSHGLLGSHSPSQVSATVAPLYYSVETVSKGFGTSFELR